MYDDDFRSGSHDDHLSSLDDLIASSSQEIDGYANLHTYSRKNHALTLLGFLYK